jgi:hypothetical protein
MFPLDVPKKYRQLHQKAMSGKSRRAAIRCHCLMCVGWSAKEVVGCTATGCPSYPYRMNARADVPLQGVHGAARIDANDAEGPDAPDAD